MTNGSRCTEHQSQRWREKDQKYKSPEDRRFYAGPRWRKFRKWFLAEHYRCEATVGGLRCASQATVVDHVLPRREYPELAFAPTNCQALCKRCHDRKTAGETFHGRRAAPGRAG